MLLLILRKLRALWRGFRAMAEKPARDREIADEVGHYFEQVVARHEARGLSDADALRAAQLEMGNMTAIREEVRSSGWEHSLETMLADVRYAVRRLRSNPAFTAVAILSLALGIGANTAIFSLVNATLIRHLPVAKPEEIAYVNSPSGAFSYPDFAELREHNTVFSGLIAWGGITSSVGIGNETDLISGLIVSGNFFDLLGLRPEVGRLIGPADDLTPGAHPVTVISDGLWKRRFGGKPDVIGRDIRFNGSRFTIIGVAPQGFGGPVLGMSRDLYVPMMMQAIARPPRGGYSGEMNPDLLQKRSNRWLSIAGRLKPGTSPAQALAQLTSVTREQEARNPIAPASGSRPAPASVVLMNDGDLAQRARLISVSKLLMSVVGAVLLIACVNVANLLLARATARRKEIAVRLAIGASRRRLVRQLLTESLVLSTLGGVAGLSLAWLAIRALRASPPPAGALPITLDFALDARVLAFTIGLALVTGILFGLVPALRSSRPQLVPALKDQSASTGGASPKLSGRNALVVLQVGLSMMLLISAGLFLRSFQSTQNVESGYDVNRMVVAPVSINLLRYTRAQGRQYYRALVERVEALPGVESATLSRWLPLTGGGSVRAVQVEGGAPATDLFRNEGNNLGTLPPGSVNVNTVATHFFRTLGVKLLKGRDFSVQDDSGATAVAIVNETFVRKHFGDTEPVGRRISFGGATGPWIEVVGVAGDTKIGTLSEAPEPLVYVPLLQNHETGVVLEVRSKAANPAALVAPVRNTMQELERDLPAANVAPFSETVSLSLYTARAGARLLLGFAAVAVLLAAIGLYGVMSYGVSRRTRELGLRMALGARPSRLVRQILGEGTSLVVVGVAVGLVGAVYATRLLTIFLYGVSTTDAVTYVVIPCVMIVVALAASLVPALRATRIDPIKALKQE